MARKTTHTSGGCSSCLKAQEEVPTTPLGDTEGSPVPCQIQFPNLSPLPHSGSPKHQESLPPVKQQPKFPLEQGRSWSTSSPPRCRHGHAALFHGTSKKGNGNETKPSPKCQKDVQVFPPDGWGREKCWCLLAGHLLFEVQQQTPELLQVAAARPELRLLL